MFNKLYTPCSYLSYCTSICTKLLILHNYVFIFILQQCYPLEGSINQLVEYIHNSTQYVDLERPRLSVLHPFKVLLEIRDQELIFQLLTQTVPLCTSLTSATYHPLFITCSSSVGWSVIRRPLHSSACVHSNR